jgi:IS30 family transposase
MPFKHFSDKEKDLLSKWRAEGKAPLEIATLLSRNLGTIVRHLQRMQNRKKIAPTGRPKALTEQQKTCLVRKVKQMTEAADAKYQVTAATCNILSNRNILSCCTFCSTFVLIMAPR